MSGYILTNPIFKTKIISYERLAYKENDVWFREYKLFEDSTYIDMYVESYKNSSNIRNVEVYDILIDLSKPETNIVTPERVCKGCGKRIEDSYEAILVNGEQYCEYSCFCDNRKIDYI